MSPLQGKKPQNHSPSTRTKYGCVRFAGGKKAKGSPYSITERRVPEPIPVLDSQPAGDHGDVSHNPGGRLPLLSARPAVKPQPFLLRGGNEIIFQCEYYIADTRCMHSTAGCTTAVLPPSIHQ